MNLVFLMLVPSLVCLLLFWLTCKLLLNRSWIPGFLQGLAGLSFLAITGVSILLAWDLTTFKDASQKQPLAVISFTQQGAQKWSVDVTSQNTSMPVVFDIRGELWTFETGVLSIDNDSGFSVAYGRPHAVKGRFLSLEQEREADQQGLVHQLHNPLYGIDSWLLLELVDRLIYIEAKAVRSRSVPFKDGAIYEIWLTNGQLDIRPLNDIATLMRVSADL